MEIRPGDAELFHAEERTEGRTDGQGDVRTYITKLTVAYRKFEKAPER